MIDETQPDRPVLQENGKDELSDFSATSFSHDGTSKRVYRKGDGPGIVVISEMPGITPAVATFARRLVSAGYTVAMPDLFGEAGRPPSNSYIAKSIIKGCISREFTTWAANETSPVTDWLRALASDLHEVCGGPGVGAIGMCFTGNFALGMMLNPSVIAPVLSQPAMPMPIGLERRRSIGLSRQDLRIVKDRVESGCAVLGMRFTNDVGVPAERFERLREEFGDNFTGIEIDSSPSNEFDIPKTAHAVVTEDLVDEPGHPTHSALSHLMTFFQDRLQP